MNKCYADCAIDIKSSVLLKCNGLCGKSYHPQCIGLGKRSIVHLNEYLEHFSFNCDECKDISLSHVLLAIKCLSESFNSITADNKLFQKHVSSQFQKINDFDKCFEELHSAIESVKNKCESKCISIDKKLAELTDSLAKANIGNQMNDRFDVIQNELKSMLGTNIGSKCIETLNNNLISLRSDLDCHFQSTSKVIVPSSREHSPLLEECVGALHVIFGEIMETRQSIIQLADDMKVTSCKIDGIPMQQPSPYYLQNNSIFGELMDITRFAHIPAHLPPTYPAITSGSEHPPAPKQSAAVLSLQPNCQKCPPPALSLPACQPPPPSRLSPTIYRFGTAWTLSEWKNRLDKLNSNADYASLFVKGAPHLADAQWITGFFFKTYSITIDFCERITSTRSKHQSFKINVPAKYQWLFNSNTLEGIRLGNMTITQWTNKRRNFQAAHRRPSKSAPLAIRKSKSSATKKPHPKPLPKRNLYPFNKSSPLPPSNSNWSYKTNIFPTFTPHKLPANLLKRVSFDLKNNTNNQPTKTKYPNFIHTHTINPSSSSNHSPSLIPNPSPSPPPIISKPTLPQPPPSPHYPFSTQ